MADKDTTIPKDVVESAEAVEVPTKEEELDVAAPETEEEVETPVLERDSVMSDMAARQRETRKREEAEARGEEYTPASEADPDADDDPEPKPADAPEPKDELVLLKVNGKELFKSKQEVEDAGGVAAIQKALAGDEKLNAAAMRQQELDQRERTLQEREQRITQEEAARKKAPQVQPGPAPTSEEIAKAAEAMAEDLVLGDTTKVAGALAKMMQQQQPAAQAEQQPQPPIDINQLSEKITADVQWRTELKTAQTDFARDFADVSGNPVTRQYANDQTKKIGAEHPDWTPSQILTEAGKRTRAAMGTPAPVNPLDEKRLRKEQGTDPVPAASTRGPDPKSTTQPVKTKAQIFDQISAGRSH